MRWWQVLKYFAERCQKFWNFVFDPLSWKQFDLHSNHLDKVEACCEIHCSHPASKFFESSSDLVESTKLAKEVHPSQKAYRLAFLRKLRTWYAIDSLIKAETNKINGHLELHKKISTYSIWPFLPGRWSSSYYWTKLTSEDLLPTRERWGCILGLYIGIHSSYLWDQPAKTPN